MNIKTILKERDIRINSAAALLMLALPFIAYNCAPLLYLNIIFEDSFGEYLTFAGYFLGFFLLLFGIVKSSENRKPFIILVALWFLFMAMEEISWGQRIFGFGTPADLYMLNEQREFSLHNITFVENLKAYFLWGIIAWVFVLPLISAKFYQVRGVVERLGIRFVPISVVPLFLPALFFLLFYSVLPKVDEFTEVYFAVAFLSFASSFAGDEKKENEAAAKYYHRIFAPAMTIALLITSFLALHYPDTEDMVRRGIQVASRNYAKSGKLVQAETVYRYILANSRLSETNESATRYSYGIFLKNQKKNDALAKEQFERVLAIEKNCEDHHSHSIAAHILRARVFKNLDDQENYISELMIAIDKSLESLDENMDRMSKYNAYLKLAQLYNSVDDYSNCMIYLKKAAKLCTNKWENRCFMKDVLATIL